MISIRMEFKCSHNSPQKDDGLILKNTFKKDSCASSKFHPPAK